MNKYIKMWGAKILRILILRAFLFGGLECRKFLGGPNFWDAVEVYCS